MFSALKRLVNNNDNNNPSINNSNASSQNAQSQNTAQQSQNSNGLQVVSQSLQKKFSRGVNYNSELYI